MNTLINWWTPCIYIYIQRIFFLKILFLFGKEGDWLCREVYFPFVVEQEQYYIYENYQRELKCQKLMLNLVGASMFIDLSYLFLLEPYNWDPNHGNFSSWRSRKARSWVRYLIWVIVLRWLIKIIWEKYNMMTHGLWQSSPLLEYSCRCLGVRKVCSPHINL